MKHLADLILILPLTDFDSFNGDTLISKSGETPDLFLARNNLVLDTKPDTSPAGTYYTEQLRVITDKLTNVQREKYSNRRPVIVLLYTDAGEPILWGDPEQKVRVFLTPNTDTDILDLSRKTTNSLF